MKITWKRIGLALAAVAITLTAAEWFASYFFPVQVTLYQPDDRLLFKHIPGARRLHIMDQAKGGDRILIEINDRGFRGKAVEEKKRGKRLAVYGDSLVFAENMPVEQTFVELLGAFLHERSGTPFEMINAGVIGYGVDQACLKIEQETDDLNPDGLVLVICASNDFGEFMRNKIFRLDERNELVLNRYTLDPSLLEEFRVKQEASQRFALRRIYDYFVESRERAALNEHFFVQNTPFIELYLQAAQADYQEFLIQGNNRVFSVLYDHYDADMALFPDGEQAKAKRAVMSAVLARIKHFCADQGIGFFAVVVPSAVDLCEDFEVRVDTLKYPAYSPSRLTDDLAGILEKEKIPFLNLFEAFKKNEPENLFVGYGDIHWNGRGQELAARLTASFLEDKLPLK